MNSPVKSKCGYGISHYLFQQCHFGIGHLLVYQRNCFVLPYSRKKRLVVYRYTDYRDTKTYTWGPSINYMDRLLGVFDPSPFVHTFTNKVKWSLGPLNVHVVYGFSTKISSHLKSIFYMSDLENPSAIKIVTIGPRPHGPYFR